MLEFAPTTSAQYELGFTSFMSEDIRFSDEADPSRAIFRCEDCGAVVRGREEARRHMRGHGYENEVAIWANVEELAERLDDRTAILWSVGIRLRLTPPRQPRVEDLVTIGDVVWTNYDPEKGRVVRVDRYEVHGLPCYSIIYVPLDAKPLKDGRYRESDYHYLNELVAQDRRILHLYETNDDVFYRRRQATIMDYIRG